MSIPLLQTGPSERDDDNDCPASCLYGSYDLDEQRAILARFEQSPTCSREAPRNDDVQRRAINANSHSVRSSIALLDASASLKDLLCEEFLDEEMLREQRAIMNEIQRKNHRGVPAREGGESGSLSRISSPSLNGSVSVSCSSTPSPLSPSPPPSPALRTPQTRLAGSRPALARASPLRSSPRRLEVLMSMSAQENDSGLLDYFHSPPQCRRAQPAQVRRGSGGLPSPPLSASLLHPPSDQFTEGSRSAASPIRSLSGRGSGGRGGKGEGKKAVRCAGECKRKYFVSLKCDVLYCSRCDILTPATIGLE